MRRLLAAALALGVAAADLRADVILSAEGLNTALKKMERLQQQIAAGPAKERAAALFQLGALAHALATLLNDEVAAHGSQEKGLIDLGLKRARETGVVIAYNREKQQFFYDGAAFQRYLSEAPRAERAAEAAFWLLENEFYQSSPEAPEALVAASENKKAFLRRYPRFSAAADVNVFLAIDYRDLYRHYQAAGDTPKRDRFRTLARAQFKSVVQRFPRTEPAKIAEEMLRRFEAEVKTREGGGSDSWTSTAPFNSP